MSQRLPQPTSSGLSAPPTGDDHRSTRLLHMLQSQATGIQEASIVALRLGHKASQLFTLQRELPLLRNLYGEHLDLGLPLDIWIQIVQLHEVSRLRVAALLTAVPNPGPPLASNPVPPCSYLPPNTPDFGPTLARWESHVSQQASASSDATEENGVSRRRSISSQSSRTGSTRSRSRSVGGVYHCPVARRDCSHEPFVRKQNCINHVKREHQWYIENHHDWEEAIVPHDRDHGNEATSPVGGPLSTSLAQVGTGPQLFPGSPSFAGYTFAGNPTSPLSPCSNVPELRINDMKDTTMSQGHDNELQNTVESSNRNFGHDAQVNSYSHPATYAKFEATIDELGREYEWSPRNSQQHEGPNGDGA